MEYFIVCLLILLIIITIILILLINKNKVDFEISKIKLEESLNNIKNDLEKSNKDIFSNNLEKGNWGELQLESLLESIFFGRYLTQVSIKGDNRVDFALKIKSSESPFEDILIPIDCKNNTEDYQSIIEILTQENCDKKKLTEKRNNLKNKIKENAKNISEKYIHPPKTTDFAIMYIPSEAVYAELIKSNENIIVNCCKNYKVIIAGPTSIIGLLFMLKFVYNTFGLNKEELSAIIDKIRKESDNIPKLLDELEKKAENLSSGISKLKKKYSKIENTLNEANDNNIENPVINDNQ